MTEDRSRKDRVQRGLNRIACGAPAWMQQLIGGKPVVIEGQTLSPQFALALRSLKLTGAKQYDEIDDVPVSRKVLDDKAWAFTGAPIEVGSVRDLTIGGAGNDIPARLYLPADEPGGFTGPPPVLVFLHGGGWVLGSLESHDLVARFFCHHGRVAVLSVDYRLAPEHRFPAGLEDSTAAVRWARANGSAYGFDGTRLAVGGDSAGGNLSAVVCQELRGSADAPDFQLLIVPATDLSGRTSSRRTFGNGFFITDAEIDWYENHYLGDLETGTDRRDPRVSPLLADDLSGLPPTYVAVGGFDPLRDEGEAYARALADAGVQVTLRRHTGFVHPFINGIGLSEEARAAAHQMIGALRLALRC